MSSSALEGQKEPKSAVGDAIMKSYGLIKYSERMPDHSL